MSLTDIFEEKKKKLASRRLNESDLLDLEEDMRKRIYGADGYDINGYDKDGYDVNGYDKDGYDGEGYDKDGYDGEGYDANGYDGEGYGADGYSNDFNTLLKDFRKGVDEFNNICPKSKATRNRCEKLEDNSWIVKDSDLLKYEKIAMDIENIKDRAKQFLVNLYSDQGYISFFKKKKRNSNAKNWRNLKGDYFCPSLHKADNIYQNLGKASSLKTGKPGTWINKPTPEYQCIVITAKGKQCCKTKCKSSNMCTQHYKLYKDK